MATPQYFPGDPYAGVVIFDAPVLNLAAINLSDFPLVDMPKLMDAAFPGIWNALASAGAEPCGPPVSFHRRMPSDTADLAVGVPVARPLGEPIQLTDAYLVEPVAVPAGRVGATSYFGPYDGLGQAWGQFIDTVTKAGHSLEDYFFETYVSNPLEIEDPADLRTDFVVFLRG